MPRSSPTCAHDGFRTSHEIQKLMLLSDDALRAVMDEEDIAAFRARCLRR